MIACVKIPDKRVPILIGKNGETKNRIEKSINVKLRLNEPDEVEIDGESLDVMTGENVVKAIARGFSPAKALLLKDENKTLVVLNISDNKNELIRIKARLIGTGGKTRRNLERLSGTYVSVYGKTIAIIGDPENVENLCHGLEKLIKGTSHRFVYQYLERSFSKIKKRMKYEKRVKRNGR